MHGKEKWSGGSLLLVVVVVQVRLKWLDQNAMIARSKVHPLSVNSDKLPRRCGLHGVVVIRFN